MSEKLIYVLGTPSGGTSCVAGILHHLGVNMGEPMPTLRPYSTFEDSNAKTFNRPLDRSDPADDTIARIAGPDGGRRFRDYLEWRIATAKGERVGVKIGATYWMGEPDPATLPIEILKVNRPLEDSIWSDAHYQMVGTPRTPDHVVMRATQMAGYWMAKEQLCFYVPPTLTLDFYDVLECPMDAIVMISSTFNLDPTNDQERAALAFIDPEMRNV